MPIRILLYLGPNLKNTKNIEGQQKFWYSYENDLSVKIVFLNKNLYCRPFKFTLSIPAVFSYNTGHLEFTFWLPCTNRNADD